MLFLTTLNEAIYKLKISNTQVPHIMQIKNLNAFKNIALIAIILCKIT